MENEPQEFVVYRTPTKKRRTPKRLRSACRKPELNVDQILVWADEYFRHNGRWPHHFDGPIPGTVEETWAKVNDGLSGGYRGLPGGSSLANLLYLKRGVRSPGNLPALDADEIFTWTEAHFQRTGKWPTESSGPIDDAPGETWAAVELALARGTRGLPGGNSLARMLADRGVKRNLRRQPLLTHEQVLVWADAYFRAHGHWPGCKSGEIEGADGDTWCAIDKAFRQGRRGLECGKSLATFLNQHRNTDAGRRQRPDRVRNDNRIHVGQILALVEAFHKENGDFPNRHSGEIAGASGLKWSMVDSALIRGSRGLPGGSSLVKLLFE